MEFNKLTIVTRDYRNRYNVGNYHLNVELECRFDETVYLFLEEGFKQKKHEKDFEESDLIFINRPLRKTKRSDVEGNTYKNLDLRWCSTPVLLWDTDSQALSIKKRKKIVKGIGVDFLALGNNNFRVQEHRDCMPDVHTFYFPFGVNTNHFYNYRQERTIASGFIGSYRNYHYPGRKEVVEWFKMRMGDRFFWQRMVKEKYVQYLNDINIFVLANDRDEGFFMKHLETMCCGCMLLAEYTPLLDKFGFVEGYHLVTWQSLYECEEKLLYYLAFPEQCREIAARGEEAARRHTWSSRVDKLLEILDGQDSDSISWVH